MIPLAFLLALVAVTIAVLIIAAVSVGRELGRLGQSLARFESDTRPVLEEIRRGAEEVADRMERIRASGDQPENEDTGNPTS